MTKVRFHGPVAAFSGAMDEMVFVDQGKRTVAYMKKHYPPSEAQAQQRARLTEAAAYAKAALADPAKRALYQPIAEQREIPINSLVIADYLTMPSFQSLDLTGYKGQVGDPIQIRVEDVIGLASVQVAIDGMDGTPVERGNAVEAGLRSGYWVYTAARPVAPGTDLVIEVVGTDHTGKQVKVNEYPVIRA